MMGQILLYMDFSCKREDDSRLQFFSHFLKLGEMPQKTKVNKGEMRNRILAFLCPFFGSDRQCPALNENGREIYSKTQGELLNPAPLLFLKKGEMGLFFNSNPANKDIYFLSLSLSRACPICCLGNPKWMSKCFICFRCAAVILLWNYIIPINLNVCSLLEMKSTTLFPLHPRRQSPRRRGLIFGVSERSENNQRGRRFGETCPT